MWVAAGDQVTRFINNTLDARRRQPHGNVYGFAQDAQGTLIAATGTGPPAHRRRSAGAAAGGAGAWVTIR